MYSYSIIPGALIITLVIMFLVSLLSRRPVRGLWLFFLIVFLATWAGQLWVTPFGPMYWGIAWIPLLVVSVFFWLLILALLPPLTEPKAGEVKTGDSGWTALGVFFWIMLLLLILSIAIGYYRTPVHPGYENDRLRQEDTRYAE